MNNIPEIHVGKTYVVIMINNQVYKIAKEYDEDVIKLEVEYMNEARSNGIPVPKVIEVKYEGVTMAKARGQQASLMWNKFDINKKKKFVKSLTDIIKKLPEKDNLYLVHSDLNLKHIFANDDGEITDIIDWRGCEYLQEAFIRRTPSFLCKGNNDNSEADTEILSGVFYKEMGKLSELEEIVTELYVIANKPDSLEYAKSLCKRLDNTI